MGERNGGRRHLGPRGPVQADAKTTQLPGKKCGGPWEAVLVLDKPHGVESREWMDLANGKAIPRHGRASPHKRTTITDYVDRRICSMKS